MIIVFRVKLDESNTYIIKGADLRHTPLGSPQTMYEYGKSAPIGYNSIIIHCSNRVVVNERL